MSRIGKQIITIPSGVTVSFDAASMTVKGPKGELKRAIRDTIVFNQEGSTISSSPRRNDKLSRALWGTYMAHLKNMVHGVTESYEKKLVVEGVGFKWDVKGDTLNLSLGFSHPVTLPVPQGLTVTAEKNTLTISGIDKESVGQFAMKIRSLKKPEPYKGKGIRYSTEVIRRKQGKKSA